jgi:hypothetical protein
MDLKPVEGNSEPEIRGPAGFQKITHWGEGSRYPRRI